MWKSFALTDFGEHSPLKGGAKLCRFFVQACSSAGSGFVARTEQRLRDLTWASGRGAVGCGDDQLTYICAVHGAARTVRHTSTSRGRCSSLQAKGAVLG